MKKEEKVKIEGGKCWRAMRAWTTKVTEYLRACFKSKTAAQVKEEVIGKFNARRGLVRGVNWG